MLDKPNVNVKMYKIFKTYPVFVSSLIIWISINSINFIISPTLDRHIISIACIRILKSKIAVFNLLVVSNVWNESLLKLHFSNRIRKNRNMHRYLQSGCKLRNPNSTFSNLFYFHLHFELHNCLTANRKSSELMALYKLEMNFHL